jgi:tetratricopeptide (TPR) repeat protein
MKRLTHALSMASILMLGGLHLAAASIHAQEGTGSDHAPSLYGNLGDYSRPVTTNSELAQAYFDQGLRLAYSFARADAARSFRAAQEHDPECAMCYWGEAWALGPYQNNPAGVGEYDDAFTASREAIQRIEGVQGWERALIEGMAARYPDAARGEAATEAYADAMARAAGTHGSNPEVATLFAESLMMFRPWDLYRDDGEPYDETRRAVQLLERVLADDLSHPGACHLYIHAVEPWRPERAEACADLLAATVPGVAHMQHMPSHIYMNIGRYGDAVRGNQEALIVAQASEHDEGFVLYPGHNEGMLVFAAWMDGQSGVALSAARDLARLNPAATYQYELQLARFGRWDELLERTTLPEQEFQRGLTLFPRGLAHLRSDDPEAAVEALEMIRAVRHETPDDATYAFFGFPQRDMLGMAENILAGEIAAAEGRFQAAESYLRAAIQLEDGLPYAEPEPWPIPARHVLGAVLLEADRPALAEAVYREALQVHPDNGWSLKGLQNSLEAQGRTAEARQAKEAFEEAWERADIWLPASRF